MPPPGSYLQLRQLLQSRAVRPEPRPPTLHAARAGDAAADRRDVQRLGRLRSMSDWKAGRPPVVEIDQRPIASTTASSPTTTTCRRWRARWASATSTFHSFSQELRLNGARIRRRPHGIHVGRLLHGPAIGLRDHPGPALFAHRAYAVPGRTIRSMPTPWHSSVTCRSHHRPPDDEPWRAPHRRAQGLHILAAHLCRCRACRRSAR